MHDLGSAGITRRLRLMKLHYKSAHHALHHPINATTQNSHKLKPCK